MFRFVVRTVLACCVVAGLFIVTQDIQIFPGMLQSFMRKFEAPPFGVEEHVIPSADTDAYAWSVKADVRPRKQIALLFHGNGETLHSFYGVQRWFQAHGITSYAVEYPGYGGRGGWPTEKGIYRHAEEVARFMMTRENVTPRDVIVFGNSIGSGPAAYIAAKYQVGALVLLAPYTSVPDVVREMPMIGALSSFVLTKFPVRQFVEQLTTTCVVAAHGRRDTTIPSVHSERLRDAYAGSAKFSLILDERSGHNEIFARNHEGIWKELASCFDSPIGAQ